MAARDGMYKHVSRVHTVSGAQTGLFVAKLERLFVAARARGSEAAAVWEFRPAN